MLYGRISPRRVFYMTSGARNKKLKMGCFSLVFDDTNDNKEMVLVMHSWHSSLIFISLVSLLDFFPFNRKENSTCGK